MTHVEPSRGRGLGVVVVHYGAPAPTLASLAAIVTDPSLTPRRVVVVDNSANLPAGAIPTSVAILRCEDNPGFGMGANRGVAHLADPSLVGYLIFNGDVEVLPGYLDAAAKALDGGVGAAGGPLMLDHAAGELWYAGGRIHSWLGTVSHSHRLEDAHRGRDVAFIPGAAIAISSRAWLATGGFDPAFFLYNEDLDLCLRLRRAGFSLRFVPEMAAVHRLGSATGSRGRSPLYLENISRTRLLPFRSRLHRLWLALLHTGWVCTRVSVHALRGRAPQVAALLRGHRAALASAWSRRLPT